MTKAVRVPVGSPGAAGQRPRAADAPPRLDRLTVLDQAPPVRITFGERVYADLRRLILTVQLRPGTAVSENELAAMTGTSRTPVREAIRRLAEERLVEVTPQQGTLVSRIDVERARQAVFVRQSIECEVLRACPSFTPAALRGLRAELLRHEAALAAGDTTGSAERDEAFHAALMLACGCPEATTATRAVSSDIVRILFLSGNQADYLASVLTDHARLVDDLTAGNKAAAIDLLHRHLGGFVIDQDRLRRQSAAYFVST